MADEITTYADYDRSLERLVMIDEPVHEQVRAAFEAGRRSALGADEAVSPA